MTSQLTYGLKDNQLIHVDMVENGLACECICANCKSPLVARNGGKERAHHFAHYNTNECAGALETALHLLAKQVFLREKKFVTPSYEYDVQNFGSVTIYESKEITFESVKLEERLDFKGTFIIPDAIGYIEGKPIFLVEFANTHFIDDKKLSKIQEGGFICIEICLIGTPLDEQAIIELLNSPENMTWINYPKLFDSAEKLAEKKRIKLEEEVEVYYQNIIKEEAEHREKNKQLLNTYRRDSELDLFSQKKLPISCPIVQIGMKNLINPKFHKHSILKRIIDGEYWNGEVYGKIYGYHSYGKYIFLKKEKIFIYPEDSEYDASKRHEYDFFFRGINEIIRVRKKGDCYTCQHYVNQIQSDDLEKLVVCDYRKSL